MICPVLSTRGQANTVCDGNQDQEDTVNNFMTTEYQTMNFLALMLSCWCRDVYIVL